MSMKDRPILVLKIGGNQVEDEAFLEGFVAAVRRLLADHALIVVHGGGREIAELHAQMQVPFETVEGLRVTSEASLRLVEMALNGTVNTRLVRWLVNGGVAAVGLSGVDLGLVRVAPLRVNGRDLGRVGAVQQVNGGALRGLLDLGLTPVISPVSLGEDGLAYNVNADHVAAGVARAVEASRLIFVSNVPGVQAAGRTLEALTVSQVEALIARGLVTGGMIPKVRAAAEAVASGVQQAAITDLAGLAEGGGTAVRKDEGGRRKDEGGRMKEAGMDAGEIMALEERYLARTYARAPFVLERGEGCWVYDTDGRAYLDCVAGIAVNALGHADPGLVAALTRQAGALWHVSNLYHTAPHARLAAALCESSFADRVFFCNSGTEAVEGAFKFARKWAAEHYGPDKHAIVAFSGAFHGRTFGALAATPREKYQAPFRPLLPGVRIAPFNDLDGTAAVMADDVCAVIVEPVQGEGGVHPAEPGFLAGLRALCDQHHALLITDEVQCGLGRTGTLWAHQACGVTPDMLTAAKPLAGGLPMGAVLMTEAVAEVLQPGDHGSTFAASPLVASVAEAVLARVSQPAFLADVAAKGAYLMERLAALGSPHIRQVRGRGLMIGADLDVPANDVVSAGYRHGLLLVNAGPDTLRLVPPLTITREEINLLLERLAEALAE